MYGTMLYGTRDVRYEEVPKPKIEKPTDAIRLLLLSSPVADFSERKQP